MYLLKFKAKYLGKYVLNGDGFTIRHYDIYCLVVLLGRFNFQ